MIKGCRPKNFGGEEVTGPAMVDMIEAFAESFNSGKIPSIKSAWTQISEDEYRLLNAVNIQSSIHKSALSKKFK